MTMDLSQVQDLFFATDDGDAERLVSYLHPDLVLNMVGVDGVDAPFDREAYFGFLKESIAYREERGERTEHVPAHVQIEGNTIAVRGYLRIASKQAVDEYHPYMDLLKLRDGKIVEYNIAFGV